MANPSDAERLLSDPALTEAREAVKNEIIRKMATANLDGSQASKDYVYSLAQLLQAGDLQFRLLGQQLSFGKLDSHELERKSRLKQAMGAAFRG